MGRFADILERAAEKTNAELDADLAALTTLRQRDIERLAPTRADKERLARLLEIVNASTSQNRKTTELKRHIDDLAGIVVKTLRYLT